jgi:hypothetical protein
MALAFGVEFDPEDMGAPHFTHGLAPTRGRPAALARKRPARSAVDASPETIRRENATIADAFGRIADIVGLAEDERAVLFGAARDPSRVILALETIGAALDLCGAPQATLDWLRNQIPQAPFNGRTPLILFAADGQFGVEITLLYLRARLRDKTAASRFCY